MGTVAALPWRVDLFEIAQAPSRAQFVAMIITSVVFILANRNGR